MLNRLAGLMIAGLLGASCAGSPAPVADPSGVWTLIESVMDDGTVDSPDAGTVTMLTVDLAGRTIVSQTTRKGSSTFFSDLPGRFAFTVTPEGNWRIGDAGPGKEFAEFAVECTPSSLTFTRNRYFEFNPKFPMPKSARYTR